MTPDKSSNKILSDFLNRIPKASQRQIEDARSRIWERIAMQPIPYNFAGNREAAPHRRSYRFVFAAMAATALLLVAAGVTYREVLNRRTFSKTALKVIDGDLQLMKEQQPASIGTRIVGGEMVFSK